MFVFSVTPILVLQIQLWNSRNQNSTMLLLSVYNMYDFDLCSYEWRSYDMD